MRLFHVSEESDINIFNPRIPDREDMDKTIGLVWAIDEKRLPNFLTPRNCPRVTYHMGENTSEQDKTCFFSSPDIHHVVIIESKWFETMKNTQLFLYEFDTQGFELQDDIAGYYVSKTPQIPIAKYIIDNLFEALFERNVELRIIDNLWDISDRIKQTTLNWSMCRMGFATSRAKLLYPSVFHKTEKDGFWVSYPDFPECLTEGDNMEQAYDMAVDALRTVLSHMKEKKEDIPVATSSDLVNVEDGQLVIVEL